MAKRKYRFRKREFLNADPTRRAFMIVAVEDRSELLAKAKPGDYIWNGESVFGFGDCNRDVWLDFNINEARERRNSLRKIDKIFEAVKGFRDALYKEAALAEKHLTAKGTKKGAKRVKSTNVEKA